MLAKCSLYGRHITTPCGNQFPLLFTLLKAVILDLPISTPCGNQFPLLFDIGGKLPNLALNFNSLRESVSLAVFCGNTGNSASRSYFNSLRESVSLAVSAKRISWHFRGNSISTPCGNQFPLLYEPCFLAWRWLGYFNSLRESVSLAVVVRGLALTMQALFQLPAGISFPCCLIRHVGGKGVRLPHFNSLRESVSLAVMLHDQGRLALDFRHFNSLRESVSLAVQIGDRGCGEATIFQLPAGISFPCCPGIRRCRVCGCTFQLPAGISFPCCF